MDIVEDPLLPHYNIQARNYLIACFAISLAKGETLQNRGSIKAATISKYVQAAVKLHLDRTMDNPHGAATDYIDVVLKALRKYEKVPDRRDMIHDEMIRHMETRRQTLHVDSVEAALIDWIYLGRFVGFRSIEWCQKTQKKFEEITHRNWEGPASYAFIMDDIQLFRSNKQRIHDITTVNTDDIDHFTLRFRKQKNNRNYELIAYKRDLENPEFCPVQAIWRIIRRALRLRVPLLEPIAVYKAQKGKYAGTRCFITNDQVQHHLRNTAQRVYKIKKGDDSLLRWSAHSIRVTACNLLHRQGLSDSYIQTRLRWKSTAFLDYLRNTLYTADAHTKAIHISKNNLPTLTDSWEAITAPSGATALINSPNGSLIRRHRAREELEQVLHARAA